MLQPTALADNPPHVTSSANPHAYYRPELDALRFLAFLFVFSFHRMDYVPTTLAHDPWLYRIGMIGPYGVPVFFLLSAFLITELLFRERNRTGTVHVRAFYMRRILRIWPLYFAAFIGLSLLNHFLPGVGSNDPLAWLAFTFFAGNWYIYHHGWIAGSFDPLWSISVEEQFYITIPLLAAFAGRRIVAILSLALLVVAYVAVLLYALHPVAGDNGEWTNSFVQFQFFSAGTLLALVLRGRLVRLSIPLRLAGFAIAIACWLAAVFYWNIPSWEPHPTPIGSLAGWGLVLLGSVLFFLCTLGIPARFIPRWLAYLGRISYGLYIVHSFIFFLVYQQALPRLRRTFPGLTLPLALREYFWTLIVLTLSIAVASLSYRYFEQPFLRLKKRFTFIASREAATGI